MFCYRSPESHTLFNLAMPVAGLTFDFLTPDFRPSSSVLSVPPCLRGRGFSSTFIRRCKFSSVPQCPRPFSVFDFAFDFALPPNFLRVSAPPCLRGEHCLLSPVTCLLTPDFRLSSSVLLTWKILFFPRRFSSTFIRRCKFSSVPQCPRPFSVFDFAFDFALPPNFLRVSAPPCLRGEHCLLSPVTCLLTPDFRLSSSVLLTWKILFFPRGFSSTFIRRCKFSSVPQCPRPFSVFDFAFDFALPPNFFRVSAPPCFRGEHCLL